MSDEPIVEIVTTSDPVVEVVEESAAAPVADEAAPPSRWRGALMIAGAILGALVLLGGGLALGYFAREVNEKQFVDQITLLRGALQRNAEGWQQERLAHEATRAELASLKAGNNALTASLAVAQAELKQLRESLAAATPGQQQDRVSESGAGNGPRGYVRFSNTRCVVRPGEKVSDMESCLRGQPQASGASTTHP